MSKHTSTRVQDRQTVYLPNAEDLEAHRVYLVSYDCTRRGIEDTGTVVLYWTGEQDLWGKLTLCPVDGGPTIYLFPDEIMEVEEFRP